MPRTSRSDRSRPDQIQSVTAHSSDKNGRSPFVANCCLKLRRLQPFERSFRFEAARKVLLTIFVHIPLGQSAVVADRSYEGMTDDEAEH